MNSMFEAKFIALATAIMAISPSFNDFFLGQPVHVIVFAFAGCFIGVWNKNYQSRIRLLKAFAVSAMTTVGFIVIIPDFFGYKWPNTNVQAAMAMLLGFSSQTWGPAMFSVLAQRFTNRKENAQ
ncbi:hypothetical protein [Stenotrophomonas phage BUCT627]|uniref:Uncharacterized protein n=2 Tax=Bixiavirus TaxID=3044676 RepID=A0AC61NA19_9CAUD|nr:hypothetical protein PQD76_gp11 [Stenotrophomonas phage BUCT626]YP_010677497.1 hypothetical protein PQD77_gp062 [Stenotrophomonas phage BUCT627]QYC96697.1 hypothetical protein [Stenotrophomonas phage BUCT627]QYC96715.1 hypothetical protein [Stenotrophomonas phage BUCT626]